MKKTVIFIAILMAIIFALTAIAIPLKKSDEEVNYKPVLYIDGSSVNNLTDETLDKRVGFFYSRGKTYFGILCNNDIAGDGNGRISYQGVASGYTYQDYETHFWTTHDMEIFFDFDDDNSPTLLTAAPKWRSLGYFIITFIEVPEELPFEDAVSMAAELEDLPITDFQYDLGETEGPGAE